MQLTLGPDGNIYPPTVPIKGYLGGTLVRVNPKKNWRVNIYRDLIHNQSFSSVVAVPETGELFVTSSIAGGSSSKPTEKAAWVILWDTKTEQVDFKTQPVPGATSYGKAVRAPDGTIHGTAGNRYYVFDPVNRETVFTGALPGRAADASPRPLVLSDGPASDGLIYGVDSLMGNLVVIDPTTRQVKILAQDASFKGTRFAQTEPDGNLYYQDGAKLMRVKVVGN